MGEQRQDEAFHFAGDRLGKFVVLGELGRGSMGVVYEAFQEDLKRKVALKVLPANIALDVKQVQRFRREAESVARLQHPNVIQIYEVGQLDNTHYFAMELIEGAPFGKQSFIRDRAFVDEAARIARDAARGLAHAHEKGVIHRDIKPGNLLVDKQGRVVVTDFGLARLTDSTSLTSTDAIVGTPKYMAPEQILPGTYPLDGRCDVYGLGATLYEAVCGNPPVEAPTVQAFLRSVLEERPAWPRRKNRLIPHDLATIMMRCLEKHPNERYANAEALADDLDRYLSGERIRARPKGMAKRSLAFLARHKVATALSTIVLVASIVVFVLSGKLFSTQQSEDLLNTILRLQADDSIDGLERLQAQYPGNARIAQALRAEILQKATRLQTQDALDQLVELAERYPDNPDVVAALRAKRRQKAMNLLELPLDKAEAQFGKVLELLEQSETTPGFWRLVMLIETNRPEDARALLDEVSPDAPWLPLIRARILLREGKFEEAAAMLSDDPADDAPPEQRSLHYLTRARALRAQSKRDYEGWARDVELARTASSQLPQLWITQRADQAIAQVMEWQGGAGRVEAIKSLFRSVQEYTNALMRNLAQIAENLSTEERSNVQGYIERVLKLAGEEATGATDLVERGRQHVEAARARGDAREQAIGYLLQAIGLLSTGDRAEARTALKVAEDLNDASTLPYIAWAFSLLWRAENNTESALDNTRFAISMALDLDNQKPGFPQNDWNRLLQHASLLLEQLRREDPKAAEEHRRKLRDAMPAFYQAAFDALSPPASDEADRE